MMRAEINGAPATADELHRMAVTNYGHFTSMQVRDGAVRGIDLHVRRLEESSRELFGRAVDGSRVFDWIRQALAGTPDASVRVTVVGSGRRTPAGSGLSVLVSVTDPAPAAAEPDWRLRTTAYVRDLPHLKHVATMGLIRHWQRALADGFDDALFIGPDGLVSEGTAWNLALWDGERAVWPDAPQLSGITMQLLRDRVPSASRPIHREDLARFSGAVATYSSWPAQPVRSIDEMGFEATGELEKLVMAAWDEVPWDPV